MPPPRATTSNVFALAAILAIGAALRVFHLGAESVWFDEAYSIQLAQGPIAGILSERWVDIHPPLYYLTLHYWIALVGRSEFSVRLMSTVFDLAGVAAAYAAASRLCGRRVAMMTALLLAVSPFHVEYSQEGRMYALLCLLSTLSMSAFTASFDEPRRRWQAAYVVSTTLMLYTHVYAAFILMAQMVILAVARQRHAAAFRRVWRPWLRALFVVAILFAPWMMALADQVIRVQGAFWISRPLWIAVLHPFLVYSGSAPLFVLCVPLAIVGWRSLSRSSGERPEGSDDVNGVRAHGGASSERSVPALTIVASWLVLPTIVPFLLSQISAPIFLPKYTIAASVPFALLMAIGLLRLPRMPWRIVAAAAFAGLLAWRFQAYFSTPHKDGWRRAAATLEAEAQPGDTILFYPWYNQVPYDYYHRREDLVRQWLVPDIHTIVPAPEAVPALVGDAVAGRHRVWLVAQPGMSERSLIVAELGRRLPAVRHTAEEHVDLFLFEQSR